MIMANLLERMLMAYGIIIFLALLAWLAIGYLLFRTYRQARPDWHDR